MTSMALNKTAYHIRRVAPERHVARAMRWVLMFCLGYALCHVLHLEGAERSPVHECGQ